MKSFFVKIGAWLATIPLLLLPSATYAQLSKSTENLATVKTALGADVSKTLPELIGQFIRVFLGVLGIIFVIYVVYAGYIYMTAGGDDTKIQKSKKMIGTAVIGIILIVAAYAISEFVINAIISATTGI